MKDIFDAKTAQDFIHRIQGLSPQSQPQWGKMSVAQMLAHCNVTYELVYEPAKHPKPGFISRLLLRKFVKPKVVNDLPYRQNLPTGKAFIVSDEREFDKEQKRLIGFIQKTQQLGAEAFDGKVSVSFGKLTAKEWNAMFAKHLEHHLSQFGV